MIARIQLGHCGARREVVVLVHPGWNSVRVGAKRECHAVEAAIAHVVDLASEPFHANELVVGSVESEVDARDAAGAMFDTLFFVDVHVE